MTKMKEMFTECVGWVGVLCILVAYGLLTFGVLDAGHMGYHTLNLVGGMGIIIDAIADKNYQPAVLNVVWIAIAVFAIVRVF
jgi:hypothetical protein